MKKKGPKAKKVLILGGYGGTGKPLCRTLLAMTDVSITIAGRDLNNANELCRGLQREFPVRKISTIYADAADSRSLEAAFEGSDLVIDATTATAFVKSVAAAALNARADYLDFHFEQKVVSELEPLREQITNAGRVFITQAGFHPGLPAAFVRFAAPQFDIYDKAIIGMAMSARIDNPESVYELVDVLADYTADIFVDGEWRPATYKDAKKIDFGPLFGTRTCYPIQMEEMYALPDMFPLRDTGVYVAGFNWFVDYLVFPLAFVLPRIKKGLGRHMIAKLLIYGLNNFSGSAEGVSFVLDAEGRKNGQPAKFRVTAEHADAYIFTAIPVVACVQQILAGTLAVPGLHLMGHVVEPNGLMKDMVSMGMKITTICPK